MKFKSLNFPVCLDAAFCKARSRILHLLGPVHDGDKCGLATSHFGLDVPQTRQGVLAWLCAVGLGLASLLFHEKSSQVVQTLVFDCLREYLGAKGARSRGPISRDKWCKTEDVTWAERTMHDGGGLSCDGAHGHRLRCQRLSCFLDSLASVASQQQARRCGLCMES